MLLGRSTTSSNISQLTDIIWQKCIRRVRLWLQYKKLVQAQFPNQNWCYPNFLTQSELTGLLACALGRSVFVAMGPERKVTQRLVIRPW